MPKNKERGNLEHLALMALKNKIEALRFSDLIVEAWNRGEAKLQSLTVTCREKTGKSAVFLFASGDKILAQFPISTKALQEDLEGYLKYRLESVRRKEEEKRGNRGRPNQKY